MTLEQLRKVHQARPFRPFILKLADGNQIGVSHPEFLAHSATGRTAIVFGTNETYEVIDLLLVASIEVGDGRSDRHRRRRSGG